ncbi:arginyl-tRNA synthetase [Brevinema andersonii]|uniref:Arginine--tRNA ligase n=1 Tax=Brevinema andersonii TaxID=34097 RepID=A0A1I1DUD1_BREAD|nr:arginine--tRNA ligase [Brevinema andersonii]SFB78032.1 arginyl-tRNA synthetase [Brevinema andersonii]
MINCSPKESIRYLVTQALIRIGAEIPHFIAVESPENPEYGHYAVPIAMQLARSLKKNPRLIAQEIYNIIHQDSMFSKVEIARAGYLNFFLSSDYLEQKLQFIMSHNDYGKNSSLQGKHILLEYVSANPTGPLHIGHGRWAAIGDSLARFLSFSGASVHREFYINDAGIQIAHLNESVQAVLRGDAISEDGYHGTYITELAQETKALNQPPEQIMLEKQKATLNEFRVVFDTWFSEKTLHESGDLETAIQKLKGKNAAYTKDGALWFRSSELGKDDKDRVLVKSDGSYTYFAADIAYHFSKIKRGYSFLIDILGADHHGYVERIAAAVKIFGGELFVLLGQLVNLFRNGEPVRMSKRTGDLISLDEVINEIGVDALRYLLLRRPIRSALDFDLEKAKIISNDNPVYYVQYAHARICSILRNTQLDADFQHFKGEHEKELLREIVKFEDIILEIAHDFDLQKLPAYLEGLASCFHRFYKNCRIIDDPNESSRLALCVAARTVFANGLELLGVSAPEVMSHEA